MPVCTDCGGTVIEYDAAAGNGFCIKCGTVVEENTIVNEVSFGETSSGAAMVQGSFVGQGATHARLTGPYGNRSSTESREQTIANASRKIQSIANVLHLSDVVCLAATRLYTLAVEHKFTKGRKSLNVVAVCLYVACRQKETRNYMLIDFSDLLQVNVFELGHTYLQLVQTLNLRLPLVDPSHYISRFAALLEFGDETHRVAADAIRLVQRFDRDWMTRGRRPAGICGAALLLAARMNNFRRSIEEIVQVVKIADTTLKKRLDEFKRTPSGALTLADFRNVWLDEEMDPPAFTKAKELEEAMRLAELEEQAQADGEGDSGAAESITKGKGKKRKRKRKRVDEEDEEDADVNAGNATDASLGRVPIDPSLLDESILAGIIDAATGAELTSSTSYINIDPSLRPLSPDNIPQSLPLHPTEPSLADETLAFSTEGTAASSTIAPNEPSQDPSSPPAEKTPLFLPLDLPDVDEVVNAALAEEVSSILANPQSSSLTEALEEREERRLAQAAVVDELLGLDESELDDFILTPDEVRIKERVWVELNRDYLEALAAKGEQLESGGTSKSRKRRKTNKPRDASTAHGATAAESVRNLIKKNPRYSRRINYDALKDLFGDAGGPGLPLGDDKDDGEELYQMGDDKSEDGGERPVMVIEEAGSVAAARPAEEVRHGVHGNNEEGDGSDKSDDEAGPMHWEDVYEQEV
ncbi:transcription factor TFIIIB subunit brf1 [Pleurotus ostreatus]|uniref:B-related factor 1 n=1 Tax=Pleurotus ostreatus TaxID=5322 RepID=A0A8H6ZTL8_PLEOS|nr:transcription factor TFIIIB subunit brf1 [Pleurotus ostreatus]KAF7430671.1 transcription factor TFIIIB subunit brf1 [Pleurotus ostreatus]